MKKIVLFSFMLISILLTNIFICENVNYGGNISEIEEKIQNLKSENKYLEGKIALMSSYREVDTLNHFFALKR